MAGVNRWHGIGNMTADPKYARGEEESRDRTEFSIAINKPGADRDAEPTYLDLVAWSKVANQVNDYGRKGRMVYVEGEIEIRKWQDKETDQTRKAFRIKAWVVRFLDKPPDRDDDRGDDRGRSRDDDRGSRRSRDDDRREERPAQTSRAEDFSDLPF